MELALSSRPFREGASKLYLKEPDGKYFRLWGLCGKGNNEGHHVGTSVTIENATVLKNIKILLQRADLKK